MATLRWGAVTHEGQLRTQNEDNHHVGDGSVRRRRRDGRPPRRRGGQRDGGDAPRRAPAVRAARLARRPRRGDQRSQRRDLQRLGRTTPNRPAWAPRSPRSPSSTTRSTARCWRSPTSATRAATCCATAGCARSRSTTASCRSSSPKARSRRDEARHHPRRNIVTRALGIEPYVRVDTWTMPIIRGDRFLLCSDGLVDEVADDVIQAILADAPRRPDGGRAGAGRRRQRVRRARQHHGGRGRRARGRRPARPDRGVRRHPGVERRRTSTSTEARQPDRRRSARRRTDELVPARRAGGGTPVHAWQPMRDRRTRPAPAAGRATSPAGKRRRRAGRLGRVAARARRRRRARARLRDPRRLGPQRLLRGVRRRRHGRHLPRPSRRLLWFEPTREAKSNLTREQLDDESITLVEQEIELRDPSRRRTLHRQQPVRHDDHDDHDHHHDHDHDRPPSPRPPTPPSRHAHHPERRSVSMAATMPVSPRLVARRRSTELTLIVMAAAITGVAYTLASLGANAVIPARLGPFLALRAGADRRRPHRRADARPRRRRARCSRSSCCCTASAT